LYDIDPTITTSFCYTQLQCTSSGRYCVPVEPVSKRFVNQEMNSPMNLMKRVAGDISLTADLIVVGSFVSILIAALFFELTRRPEKTKFIIWGSIAGTIAGIFGAAYFLRLEYLQTIEDRCLLGVDREGCGGFKAGFLKVLMYIAVGLAIFYIILIFRWRKRIKLGIGLIKLAGRVISTMIQMRFFPLIIIIASVTIGIFFVACITLAFSIGTVKLIDAQNIDGGKVYTIEYNLLMRVLAVIFFIMFQWWVNLILLFADAVISFALSTWFFEKKKETVHVEFFKDCKGYF